MNRAQCLLAGIFLALISLVLMGTQPFTSSGGWHCTNGDCTYGTTGAPNHVFVTDGTGDSEIQLPADSIGSAEILDNAILTSHIPTNELQSADLDTGSVNTAEITDGQVFLIDTDFLTVGTDPAATCAIGSIHVDTDETVDTNCTTTADNSLCLCTAADTWTALENN